MTCSVCGDTFVLLRWTDGDGVRHETKPVSTPLNVETVCIDCPKCTPFRLERARLRKRKHSRSRRGNVVIEKKTPMPAAWGKELAAKDLV